MDIISILIGAIAGIGGGFAIAKMLEKSNASSLITNSKKELNHKDTEAQSF